MVALKDKERTNLFTSMLQITSLFNLDQLLKQMKTLKIYPN
jgi:hypothetical protein